MPNNNLANILASPILQTINNAINDAYPVNLYFTHDTNILPIAYLVIPGLSNYKPSFASNLSF
eukprot:CAMPEP_0116933136 /NCGR_PEP_ID=MMETSP0467-20121206/28848_1 /TAXON_ID=283647 /ORGANISM="Mesodinium pulex, Strain SPMC105" /LENGTH=62 /DNA_ID=CAMNT_0004613941 /DNA_START=803 /DNA_END=991 /DNA_ORIENTATION=+